MNDNVFGKSREVSVPLRLKILFGGTMAQVLYGVFSFLMIFVLVFVGSADFSDFTLNNSPITKGNLTNVTQTNSRINKRYVFAFDYTFLVNDKTYNGTSFSTDKTQEKEVSVQYSAENPHNSRIKGMRQKTFPIYVVFIAIFPIVIFFILLFGIRKNLKAISLLKTGEIGYATLIRTEKTSAKVNNRPVMRFIYEFEDKNGKKTKLSTTTHEPERIIDEAKEMVFYDANNPDSNVLKDDLATKVVLNEDNTFKSPSFVQAIVFLLLPIIAVFMLSLGLLLY